jgi:osmoprotectant transport system substrate-binding protein
VAVGVGGYAVELPGHQARRASDEEGFVEVRAPSRPVALLAGLTLTVALALAGCTSRTAPPPPATADASITVASFDFAESEVLAEIYAQALEGAGYPVVRDLRLGPRELVFPALAGGLVELVPEYAGTAAMFIGQGAVAVPAEVSAAHAALVRSLEGTDLVALAASPAQDANVFVVTAATADRHGLRTLDDLAPVAPQLSFGGPPECPSRPLCLLGLERAYGIRFGRVFGLDVGERLTRLALEEGHIDVGLLFSTDPALGRPGGFVELTDDQGLQPAENVTPLLRRELVERWGRDLTDVIDGVSAALTTDALRELRRRVEVDGVAASDAAAAWLAELRDHAHGDS